MSTRRAENVLLLVAVIATLLVSSHHTANALPSQLGKPITVQKTLDFGLVENNVWGMPRCSDGQYTYAPQGVQVSKVLWDLPGFPTTYQLPLGNFSTNCYTKSSIDYLVMSDPTSGVFSIAKNFSRDTVRQVVAQSHRVLYPETEKYLNTSLLGAGVLCHVREKNRFYVALTDSISDITAKIGFFDDFPPYRLGYLSGINAPEPADSAFGPSYATKLAGVVALQYAGNHLYVVTGIDFYLAKISTGTGFSTQLDHFGFFQYYTTFQMVPLIGGTNCGYLVITGTQKTLLFNIETYQRHDLLVPGVNVDNGFDNSNSNATYVIQRPSSFGPTHTELYLLAWNPFQVEVVTVNMYALEDIPLPTGCMLCNATDSDVKVPTEPSLPPPQESCGADCITHFVPELAFNWSDLTDYPSIACADFDYYYIPKGRSLTRIAFEVPTPCDESWNANVSSYLPNHSTETGFLEVQSCFTNGNMEGIFAVDLDRQAIYLIHKTMWGAAAAERTLVAGSISSKNRWNTQPRDDPVGTNATFTGPFAIDCIATNNTCYISDCFSNSIRTMSMVPPYGVGTLIDEATPLTSNIRPLNLPTHLVVFEPLNAVFVNDECVKNGFFCIRKIDLTYAQSEGGVGNGLFFTTIFSPTNEDDAQLWHRFGLFHTSELCDSDGGASSGALFISANPLGNQTVAVMTLDGKRTNTARFPHSDVHSSWYPGAYFERKNTSYGEQLYAVGGDQSPDRRIFQLRFAPPVPSPAAPPPTTSPSSASSPSSPSEFGPLGTKGLSIICGVSVFVVAIGAFVAVKAWKKQKHHTQGEEHVESGDLHDNSVDDQSLSSKRGSDLEIVSLPRTRGTINGDVDVGGEKVAREENQGNNNDGSMGIDRPLLS